MLSTVITIGGVDYDATARANAGFVGIDQLTLTVDGYDELEFTVLGCGPEPPFVPGQAVALSTSDGDGTGGGGGSSAPGYFSPDFFAPSYFPAGYFGGGGSGGSGGGYFASSFFPSSYFSPDYFGGLGGGGGAPTLRFSGDILGPVRASEVETGWQFAYRAIGLKRRGDYVTLLGSDGSGQATYNLPLDDDDYLISTAGKTVGEIVKLVLTNPFNSPALAAVGIGAFVSAGPPAVLPAQTVADLAALTIVPATEVRLQGESILLAIDAFIRDWHPQYSLWVRPDGTIRVASPFDFPPHALTVPGGTAAGDPVTWPDYDVDASGCYTRYRIVGKDVRAAVLSLVDKTLCPAWTKVQQDAWTLTDFTQPKGYVDSGTLSSLTTASASVTSDFPSVHWITNFWSDNEGQIVFYDLAGVGITITDTKPVTSNTSLSPGGTATVTWDASIPLDSASYSRYRLIASAAPMAEVGRLFWAAEPGTCTTTSGFTTCTSKGLSTFVGSRLEPRFNSQGFVWANNQQNVAFKIFYPAAQVTWSRTGAWPWDSMPVPVQVNRDTGQINLQKPAVSVSADLAGQSSALLRGWPADSFHGLYHDVQVAVPYNRGDLNAYAPLPGAGAGGSDYQGTAYAEFGIEKTKVFPMDTWMWQGDQAGFEKLASERLKTMCDYTIEGTIGMHYDAWTPAFDVFTLGYSLNIAIGSAASRLDGKNLPVRSVCFRWPNEGADIHTASFRFSNRKAPFAGDSRYIHPAFTGLSFGMQEQGQVFVGGSVGGMSGHQDSDQFNGAMTTMPEESPGAPGSGAGGAGAGFGGGFDSGGIGRGPGLQKTANDVRREKRLEREQGGRDASKASRANTRGAQEDRAAIDHDRLAKQEREKASGPVGPPSSLAGASDPVPPPESPFADNGDIGGGAFGGDVGEDD